MLEAPRCWTLMEKEMNTYKSRRKKATNERANDHQMSRGPELCCLRMNRSDAYIIGLYSWVKSDLYQLLTLPNRLCAAGSCCGHRLFTRSDGR